MSHLIVWWQNSTRHRPSCLRADGYNYSTTVVVRVRRTINLEFENPSQETVFGSLYVEHDGSWNASAWPNG